MPHTHEEIQAVLDQAEQKNAEIRSHLDQVDKHLKAADEIGAEAQHLLDQANAMIKRNLIHGAAPSPHQVGNVPNQTLFQTRLVKIQTERLTLVHRLGEFPHRI